MTGAFVALLRGINVGGRNSVRMQDLADCFRAAGYASVRTHLQSGNVLFEAGSKRGPVTERALEGLLTRHFEIALTTVLRSRDELAATVAAAPAGFGSADLRSDVFFLKAPLSAAEVMAQLPELREGVDTIAPGPGALYFSRTVKEAGKTRITRLMAMPVFQQNDGAELADDDPPARTPRRVLSWTPPATC